jgi:hypothetical protein
MFGNDAGGEGFEEILRSIASELGKYMERSIDNIDLDELADSVGVDPLIARGWIESAGSWLHAHTESLDEQFARFAPQAPQQGRDVVPADPLSTADPLGTAGPHPLDSPTDEQGLALAALDSGRWIVEPGTDALAPKGEGPGPSNALGIVRELRVRDWIAADGELTLTGRQALGRWLGAAASGRRPG